MADPSTLSWLGRLMAGYSDPTDPLSPTTAPMAAMPQAVPGMGPGYMADPYALNARMRATGATGISPQAPLIAPQAPADPAPPPPVQPATQTDPSAFASMDYMPPPPPPAPTPTPPPQAPTPAPQAPSAPPGAAPAAPPQAPLGQALPPGPLPAQLPGIGADTSQGAPPAPQAPQPGPPGAGAAAGPTDPQLAAKLAALKATQAPAGQPPGQPAAPPGQTPPPAAAPGAPPAGPQAGPAAPAKSPLDAQWALTVPGESGGNPAAVNPKTGAAGLPQMSPATLQSFLASPAGQGLTAADYAKSPQVQRQAFDWLTTENAKSLTSAGLPADPTSLLVAHTLGAGVATAILKNPTQPAMAAFSTPAAATTALMTNNPAWGIQPGDTGGQVAQKINAYYQKAAAGSPAGASADSGGTGAVGPNVPPAIPPTGGSQTGSSGPPQATTDGGLPNQIPGMGQDQSIYGPGGYQPYQPASMSEKLMALAAGQASGPTAEIGFGKGLAAMNALTSQDRENVFKGQQQQAQTAALLARLPLLQAQTAATAAKPGQVDQSLGIKQQTADQGAQALQLRSQQLAQQNQIAQQRLGLQQQRVQVYSDNAQSVQSGMTMLNKETAEASAKAAQALTTDYASSGETLQKVADLQNLIGQEGSGGITGSTFKDQFVRFAANNLGLDLGVTPSGYSISQKAMTDFNTSAALGNGKAFGGRITQSEFKTLQQGVLSIGTDPSAAQAILATYQAAAQRRMQIGETWQKMAASDPAQVRQIMTNSAAGGLNGWVQQQLGSQFTGRGISSDPNAAPTPSQYAGPAATGAPAWQHVSGPQGSPPIRFRINGPSGGTPPAAPQATPTTPASF